MKATEQSTQYYVRAPGYLGVMFNGKRRALRSARFQHGSDVIITAYRKLKTRNGLHVSSRLVEGR